MSHAARSWPASLDLPASGELARRARKAVTSLASCRVGPRDRAVDRLADPRRFLAEEVGPDTYVNVMGQHRPEHEAARSAGIARRPTPDELVAARQAFFRAGLSRLDPRSPARLPLRLR